MLDILLLRFICEKYLRDLILTDQSNNETFNQKMERIEYNAILAITCAIQETFQSKLCGELGLESLKCGRWFRKLVNLL